MKQQPSPVRHPQSRAAQTDLAWVLAAALLTFLLASRLELQERITRLTSSLEAWQVDELPTTLVALSLGLAWYAWRRRRESQRLLARNRELAQQLIAVQEGERLALARELHDELAQHCTAIRVEAAYIERSREPAQTAAAAQRAAASAELLYEGVRRLLRRLRPAELDELGLVAALQSLCESCETRSRLRCSFNHRGRLDGLGEATDTAVYRVTQEAMSNTVRHAHAQRLAIELGVDEDGRALSLRIEDDGGGFDPKARSRGLGLLGAAERAAALGGSIEVRSEPGGGTCIELRIPLPRRERESKGEGVPA